MTQGPHPSVTAGAGEEWSGLAAVVGRLGRAKELGCDGATRASSRRGADGLQLLGWARKEGMLEKGFNLCIKVINN
jgi:hypothetical protein